MKARLLIAAAIVLLCAEANAQISQFSTSGSGGKNPPASTDYVPVVPQACAGQVGCNYKTTVGNLLLRGNTIIGPTIQDPAGTPSFVPSSTRNIYTSSFATTYLGEPYFPYSGGNQVPIGHIRIQADTLGWSESAVGMSVFTNLANEQGNGGPMGPWWDPSYRNNYTGQDSAGIYIETHGRTPIATAVAASAFGTTTIATPAGNVTVYTITLTTALNSTQIAAIKPLMRVETNNNYFGYVIPTGQVSPSGASVPNISADGKTLIVDNWNNAVSDIGPNVLPTGATSVSIDMLHLGESLYLNPNCDASLSQCYGIEIALVNNNVSLPPLNLGDPLSGVVAMDFYGGVSGTYGGTAFALASTGWQAAFVARNSSNSQTNGSTVGLLCELAGPDFCVYNTHATGYILASDPGNTGTRTTLWDVSGHLTTTSVHTTSSLQTDGGLSVTASGASIMGGTTTDTLSATSTVTLTGNSSITRMNANIAVVTVSALSLPCTIGNMLYASDGRKSGESSGNGSGVPVICTATTHGGTTGAWYSMFSGAAVSN